MPTLNLPTEHLHRAFIADRLPTWLTQATPAQRTAWLASAQRELQSSLSAQRLLARLQLPVNFCSPLLNAALKRDYPTLALNIETQVLVRWRDQPVGPAGLLPDRQAAGDSAVDPFGTSEGLPDGFTPTPTVRVAERLSLLAAAMRNFSPEQAEPGGLEADCVFDPPIAGLTPAQFAATCRRLDLGRQYLAHCKAVFQGAGADATLRTHLRDSLDVWADKALIDQHIEPHTYTLLRQITHPRLLWAGQAVQCCQLRMLKTAFYDGHALSNIFILLRADGRCLVISPDEPQHPLKEYPTQAAFAQTLAQSLAQGPYQAYFSRFVAQRSRSLFFQRLNQGLPDLGLVLEPVDIDLISLMHQHLVTHVCSSATATVVPTQDLDDASAAQRLAWWENLTLQVLNAAAFFVPGLGEVMAVVGATQLLSEVCIGVDDWTHGQRSEALAHFSSIADTVAMAVVGVGLGVSIAKSAHVDSLVPVLDNTGKQRLLDPDLTPYRSNVPLPDGLEANAQGQYLHDGLTYIRQGEDLYQQVQDPATGQWQLYDARLAEHYRPALRHNGAGAWQHVHEAPLQWQGAQLMRRFGALTDAMADSTLEQVREACGYSEAQLRALHANLEPLPARLHDALLRLRANTQVDSLVAALGDGQPLGEGQDYAAALLVKLPRWPSQWAIRLQGEDANFVDYHHGESDASPTLITLRRSDLANGRMGHRVLEQMDAPGRLQMLGDGVGNGLDEQAQALGQRLALQAQRNRQEITQALYDRQQPAATPAATALQRQFYTLPNAVANELVAQADATQVSLLLEKGQAPMALAEQAQLQLRALRTDRAIQGMMGRAPLSLDSSRLAIGMLAHLPGWTGQVRIELRQRWYGGDRLAMAGDDTVAQGKLIVSHDGAYQAFDDRGQELGGQQDVFTAILAALPDSERDALGVHIHQPRVLADRLVRLAVQDRLLARRLMRLRMVQPLLEVPAPVLVEAGYQQSGRLMGFLSRWSHEARLKVLYPSLSDAALLQRAGEVLNQYGDLGVGIAALEKQHATLQADLQRWAGTGEPSRLAAQDRCLQAWRREFFEDMRVLDLRNLGLDELPTLSADFSHLQGLDLSGNHLDEGISTFLSAFPGLEVLELKDNWLTSIPASIKDMPKLAYIGLSQNPIHLTSTLFEPLLSHPTQCSLQSLFMTDISLGEGLARERSTITGAMLSPLSKMPELRELSLARGRLRFDESALAMLGQITSLEALALDDNAMVLDEASRATFTSLSRLQALNLNYNPLGEAPDLTGLLKLRMLGLQRTQLKKWPTGLTELMNLSPVQLIMVNLNSNLLTEIPVLKGTPFGNSLASVTDQARPFNVNYNPLTLAARSRVLDAGAAFRPMVNWPFVEPWWGGLGQELLTRVEVDRALPQARTFYNLLDQTGESQDYRSQPEAFRQRLVPLLMTLLPEATDPAVLGVNELRREVFEIADEAGRTCGDGVSVMLNKVEKAIAAWKAIGNSPDIGPDSLRALHAMGEQMLRLQWVDEFAQRIARTREQRWLAHEQGLPLPELDLMDRENPQGLVRSDLDEAELRLKLRRQLQTRLQLPEQPQMKYTTWLDPATEDDVASAVLREATAQKLHGWIVSQFWWKSYVRRFFPEQFAEWSTFWENVSTHFDEARDPEEPFTLQGETLAKVLAVLERTIPSITWSDGHGAALRLELTDEQLMQTADWIVDQRYLAEAQLIQTLSEQYLKS